MLAVSRLVATGVELSCRIAHLDDVGDAGLEALLAEEALDVLVASRGQVVLVQELLELAPEHPKGARSQLNKSGAAT